MNNQRHPKLPDSRRGALATLCCAGALLWSCSAIVERNAEQCSIDADCAKYNHAVPTTCITGLCVPREAGKCVTDPDCASDPVRKLCSNGACAQCKGDPDCVALGIYQTCNAGLCKETGLGPTGCFRGDPVAELDLINKCSTANCVPFDNCARLKFCSGQLPPLVSPTKPDSGVTPAKDQGPAVPDAGRKSDTIDK